MTTQLPYEPPKYGAYPTAPPWATTATATTTPAPEPFVASSFPALPAEPAPAENLPKIKAPSVIPTALWTCLFSVLGAISAAKRADAAARNGHPRNPYWVTFAMAMVVNTMVFAIVAMTVLFPVQ